MRYFRPDFLLREGRRGDQMKKKKKWSKGRAGDCNKDRVVLAYILGGGAQEAVTPSQSAAADVHKPGKHSRFPVNFPTNTHTIYEKPRGISSTDYQQRRRRPLETSIAAACDTFGHVYIYIYIGFGAAAPIIIPYGRRRLPTAWSVWHGLFRFVFLKKKNFNFFFLLSIRYAHENKICIFIARSYCGASRRHRRRRRRALTDD